MIIAGGILLIIGIIAYRQILQIIGIVLLVSDSHCSSLA